MSRQILDYAPASQGLVFHGIQSSLDVHTYDTHLTDYYKEHILPRLQRPDLTDPIVILSQWREAVARDAPARAAAVNRTLQILTQDGNNIGLNHDPANEIHVYSLVQALSLTQATWDEGTWLLFWEQLADVSDFGPCPQGRTTRLMQFL